MYYNNYKPHQAIKVEKENENLKLRKKMKNSATDKRLTGKRETVWDRLSKIKKVPSTENVLEVARSRPNLTSKTCQHFQPTRHSSFKQTIQPKRKPLILVPTSGSLNKRSSSPQREFVKSQNVIQNFNNSTFLHSLPVKEIVSARSLVINSKSSSESEVDFFKLPNEAFSFNDRKARESSEDTDEEYILAPLLSSCSESKSKTSIRSLSNTHDFLQHKKSLVLNDIELLRGIVKSDSRCENLEKDPHLLKEILKTQLQNILMQEFVVKEALNKLECSLNSKQNLAYETNELSKKIADYDGHYKETQNFQIDVIFKNVPSLHKEIEILKTLGEKLETTLKSTTSHRTRRDALSQISIASTKDVPVMLNIKYEVYDLGAENYAQVSADLFGIRQCLGIVSEYCMVQKSIAELKCEYNRPFYVPDNSENVQLIRTSFEKLKQTPDELLRHVKPKSSQVTFNVLEQDPVFFYSALYKSSNIPYISSTKLNYCEEDKFPFKETFCEGVSTNFSNTLKQEVLQNCKNFIVCKRESKNTLESRCDTVKKLVISPTVTEPLICGKQRRRIRRRVTPMPVDYYHCPKNSFFKTILIGFVQMSVFLVYIMALTYPDAKC